MSFAQTLKSSPFIFLHIRFLNHVLYPRALMLMPDKEKNRKNIKSMILTCLGCNIDLSTYFFNPNLHLLKTPLPQITFMSPKTHLHSLIDPSRPQPPLVFINPRFPWWFQVDFSTDFAFSLKVIHFPLLSLHFLHPWHFCGHPL